MTTTHLTPYDTGKRCQPGVWERPATPDEFGLVDFDDDEGRTVVTVFVERNADGTHTLHLMPATDDDLKIEEN